MKAKYGGKSIFVWNIKSICGGDVARSHPRCWRVGSRVCICTVRSWRRGARLNESHWFKSEGGGSPGVGFGGCLRR